MSGSTRVSSSINTASPSLSPGRRAWLRFKRNRLGYWSLVLFCLLVVLSLLAELISNARPLLVRYQGETYFPMARDYSEKTFGGDFDTATDYLDPFIRERLSRDGNWALFAPNPYGPKTLNYFAKAPNP
ncbi:MAG TPA: ABC transporter permease, partial [Rhodoferax sp.]|nr:ABC transporter permease [Rhodoferax sp.]